MSQASELANRFAVIQLPQLLWGGNPSGMAAAAGWLLEPIDAAEGIYKIRLRERRRRKRANMVQAHKMGHRGNVTSPGTFARLQHLPVLHPIEPEMTRFIAAHAAEMVQQDNRFSVEVSASVLRMQSAARRDLPEVVRSAMAELLLPRSETASTWLVEVAS